MFRGLRIKWPDQDCWKTISNGELLATLPEDLLI
jgi:hypothetical protein